MGYYVAVYILAEQKERPLLLHNLLNSLQLRCTATINDAGLRMVRPMAADLISITIIKHGLIMYVMVK